MRVKKLAVLYRMIHIRACNIVTWQVFTSLGSFIASISGLMIIAEVPGESPSMTPVIDLALQIALLLTLGVLCQWLAWRMRLPAILPLLLVGLLLGPVLHLLDPDKFLGDLLFPIVSLGVAIILFEGSLTLRLSDIRNVKGIVRNLTSVGVLVTWAVMSAAAHYIVGLELRLSLLFGALVSVTGPTVVVPMLRSIQPTARIANILRWEGILVDPIGAVLAVLGDEVTVFGKRPVSEADDLKPCQEGKPPYSLCVRPSISLPLSRQSWHHPRRW